MSAPISVRWSDPGVFLAEGERALFLPADDALGLRSVIMRCAASGEPVVAPRCAATPLGADGVAIAVEIADGLWRRELSNRDALRLARLIRQTVEERDGLARGLESLDHHLPDDQLATDERREPPPPS